jgi:hypothetical protein
MRFRNSIGAMVLAAALLTMVGGAAAFDETKYRREPGRHG